MSKIRKYNYKMLICMRDLNWLGRIPYIIDRMKLSKTIQNIISDNFKLKSHTTIINKKNIIITRLPKRKQPI